MAAATNIQLKLEATQLESIFKLEKAEVRKPFNVLTAPDKIRGVFFFYC